MDSIVQVVQPRCAVISVAAGRCVCRISRIIRAVGRMISDLFQFTVAVNVFLLPDRRTGSGSGSWIAMRWLMLIYLDERNH